MHTLDPGIIVPNLIIGPIAVIGGILILVFRKKLREWVVDSERTTLGEERGAALGSLQTPFWTGTAGVVIAIMGSITIGFGLVALLQHIGIL